MKNTTDQAGLHIALSALRMMIDGAELTASQLVSSGGGQLAVNRRRLQALAKHLHPLVVKVGDGRGKQQVFRWVWPSRPHESKGIEWVWTLAIARTMLGAFHDGEIGRVLEELLEEQLNRVVKERPQVDHLDRMFYATSRAFDPPGVTPDTIDRIAQAIARRRRIIIRYRHFNGSDERQEIEPWTLLMADEGPYLYGKCVECENPDRRDRPRVYSVARIAAVRDSQTTFIYPHRTVYDPAAVFGDCFGIFVPDEQAGAPVDIVLRFEASMATFLEHSRIHRSQQTPERLPEGGRRVRLRLHVTYDLVRWIRGHGDTVYVEQPQNLREWVKSGMGGQEGYKRFVLDIQPGGAR